MFLYKCLRSSLAHFDDVWYDTIELECSTSIYSRNFAFQISEMIQCNALCYMLYDSP